MKLVTVPEAAKALDCSKQNIYQMIEKHNLETPKKTVTKRTVVERKIRIMQVDLDMLERIREGGE